MTIPLSECLQGLLHTSKFWGALRWNRLKATDSTNEADTESEEPSQAFGAGERYTLMALFCCMLFLRVRYAYRFRFDTDEAQHLHVVWSWVNGWLPYRDVFDNHGPLFHVLCAPLLSALGERPDILSLMRLTMIPLFGLSLLCVYQAGSVLWSQRIGAWAAVFTGFYPEFFFTSTEFRTDNLWTALWLLTIVIAVRRRFTKMRAFLVALILGMAFCVTVKTGLMIGSVLFGALVVLAHRRFAGKAVDLRFIAACARRGFVGIIIAPLGWFLFFCFHGAAREFLYCNVSHNLIPHAQNWQRWDAHVLWFPVCFLLSIGASIVFKNRDFNAKESRRMFLVFTAAAYLSALKTFFPTLSRQDDLPFIPLACLCMTPLIAVLGRRMSSVAPFQRILEYSFPCVAFFEVAFVLISAPLFRDDTAGEIAMLGTILRVTRVSDYVMDPTGEAIFRRRPFYYALETFTAVRIERGLIHDNIVHDLIETRTFVALPHGLTKSAKLFVRENYLDVGNGVWILGKRLMPSGQGISTAPIHFNVVIPGSYRIVRDNGDDAMDELDGSAARSARFLDAGEHIFRNGAGDYSGVCIFWDIAFKRGITPLPHGKLTEEFLDHFKKDKLRDEANAARFDTAEDGMSRSTAIGGCPGLRSQGRSRLA